MYYLRLIRCRVPAPSVGFGEGGWLGFARQFSGKGTNGDETRRSRKAASRAGQWRSAVARVRHWHERPRSVMPTLTFSQLADMIGGTVIQGGDVTSSTVVIDSREVKPDSVFFAIKGERLDGHAVPAAGAGRRRAARWSRDVPRGLPTGQGHLQVDDTTQRAAAARELDPRALRLPPHRHHRLGRQDHDERDDRHARRDGAPHVEVVGQLQQPDRRAALPRQHAGRRRRSWSARWG